MLTRALIVLLIVLNLGIAAWWLSRPDATEPASKPHPEGVPLLHLPQETPPTHSLIRPHAIDVEGEAASASAPEPVVPSDGQCHVFGPIDGTPARARARDWASGAITELPLPTDTPAPRAWRVVMAPQGDIEAATAMTVRLRQAGFNDLVLQRNAPEAGSILLGRFGNREAAETHRQTLADAGFTAQVQPARDEIRPAIAFALRAGASADAARLALGTLRHASIDCADLR